MAPRLRVTELFPNAQQVVPSNTASTVWSGLCVVRFGIDPMFPAQWGQLDLLETVASRPKKQSIFSIGTSHLLTPQKVFGPSKPTPNTFLEGTWSPRDWSETLVVHGQGVHGQLDLVRVTLLPGYYPPISGEPRCVPRTMVENCRRCDRYTMQSFETSAVV